MITITINNNDYDIKQNLNDITIKEYLDIIKISGEQLEKPNTDIVVSMGKLSKKTYYKPNEEPDYFKQSKRYRILNILSGIPIELFEKVSKPDYEEALADIVEGFIESLDDTSAIWNEKQIDSTKWLIDPIEQWTFQQWVDIEGTIDKGYIHTLAICAYEGKDRRTKRKYDRKFAGQFNKKVRYWSNQPAAGNINTILDLTKRLNDVRNRYKYIYNSKSAFPSKSGKNIKIYHDYSKWEDVVVSIAETSAFMSPKGSVEGVRSANIFDVLDYLNFKRGKSFAESEDYLIEQHQNEMKSKNKSKNKR